LPRIKSAKKALKVAQRRRERNKSIISRVKTFVTRAQELIGQGAVEQAPVAIQRAISTIDKAAAKGVIHRNAAARRKSRLMKKFNQAPLQPIS